MTDAVTSTSSPYARYLRILICVLTAGFVFPNVFTENMAPQQTSIVAEVDEEKK